MNAAPYTHLLWKEYRAIRGFWIALIGLAILTEVLVFAFSYNRASSIEFIYNIALGTPVFFALGCIGTAYAIEKEDGTYDWLRASPASNAQLLITKLGLALAATVAMFAILWLATTTLLAGPPEKPEVLRGMLGLWLLAAIEALTWGLLFSLLSARPLTAIVLALFATSTAVHMLSWIAQPYQADRFEYARYATAIPLRLGVLAVVAAVDMYLGLRWLGSAERNSLFSPREVEDASARRPATKADVVAMLHHRDWGTIFSRLVWQQFRQSGRTMFMLATLQILMCWIAANMGLDQRRQEALPVIPLLAFAALMGANVFQPDQQRANFRFFVEHNVPPRYVWLSRILPWLAVAVVSGVISAAIWLGAKALFELVNLVWTLTYDMTQPNRRTPWDWYRNPYLQNVLPIALLSMLTFPAFFAGQWVSMFVRSGLLSGFFSLLLAAALVFWYVVVYIAGLSWLPFLVPVPLVLLWATWLRAPDWILEKATWPARLKAAGAVLVPAALLLSAAPVSRINQIPAATPGFDPAAYVAEITPAALETGVMYLKASERLEGAGDGHKIYLMEESLRQRLRDHLKANQESLDLILQATERPTSALANPAKLTNWPMAREKDLLFLVALSARELEEQGKLDEALDRYFKVFDIQRQLYSFAPNVDRLWISYPNGEVFESLTHWAIASGQTEARLREAVARLEKLDTTILKSGDALRSNFILLERLLSGDETVAPILYPGKAGAKYLGNLLFTLRLFPWERARERRMLNLTTQNSLTELDQLRVEMAAGEAVGGPYGRGRASQRDTIQLGISTQMDLWTDDAMSREVRFEADRRIALIILACQAYRLDHGKLPAELSDLVDEGLLAQVPADPFSGAAYEYLPEGIPHPRTNREVAAFSERRDNSGLTWDSKLKPDVPCLWSPGANLLRLEQNRREGQPPIVYYSEHGDFLRQTLDEYEAWMRGQWYPILPMK